MIWKRHKCPDGTVHPLHPLFAVLLLLVLPSVQRGACPRLTAFHHRWANVPEDDTMQTRLIKPWDAEKYLIIHFSSCSLIAFCFSALLLVGKRSFILFYFSPSSPFFWQEVLTSSKNHNEKPQFFKCIHLCWGGKKNPTQKPTQIPTGFQSNFLSKGSLAKKCR